MSTYLCVGGPLHGQMYDPGHFESEFVMEEMREVEVYREQPVVYRAPPNFAPHLPSTRHRAKLHRLAPPFHPGDVMTGKVLMCVDDLSGDQLHWARMQPGSDQPKTFGCHHYMPVCQACDWMVRRWLKGELGERLWVPIPIKKAVNPARMSWDSASTPEEFYWEVQTERNAAWARGGCQ